MAKLNIEYINIVEKYLVKFLESSDDYLDFWVSDEIGGMACISYDLFIDFDSIRYCVDNKISVNTYREYQEDTLERYFKDPKNDYRDYVKEKYFTNSFPNFQNWLKGAR